MLRTPAELSDGQRYRYRLACGLARNPAWLQADEFTAPLDRTLAKVIAFNLRKLADRTSTGLLLATAPDDVVADLDPNLHVTCDLGGEIGWQRRERKKKVSAFSASLRLRPARGRTGRTLLGGITAATTWESCDS
jgi:ABC-type microcin C transport system duplicated ATPase subunit YejF